MIELSFRVTDLQARLRFKPPDRETVLALLRLLSLAAALLLGVASLEVHGYTQVSSAESARQGITHASVTASGSIAPASAERVREKLLRGYDVASEPRVDAFGNEIEREGATPTEYLYRGEQHDPNLGFYYLRARHYDARSGRFPTMDSFAGVSLVPDSLHKYSYAASNPVAYRDPSGHLFTSGFGYAVEREVAIQYAATHPTDLVEYGQGQWTGVGYLKPDIFNFTQRLFNEIKPLSPTGVSAGIVQLGTYSLLYGPAGLYGSFGLPFFPDEAWTPLPAPIGGKEVWFVNVGGLIFYTDDRSSATELAAQKTVENARGIARRLRDTRTSIGSDAVAVATINTGIQLAAAYGAIQVAQLVMRVAIAPRI